jgi:hypothetical protein
MPKIWTTLDQIYNNTYVVLMYVQHTQKIFLCCGLQNFKIYHVLAYISSRLTQMLKQQQPNFLRM